LKNELMTATGNSGVAAPLAQSSRLSPSMNRVMRIPRLDTITT